MRDVRGFSLVELSIVLVILGLLVGGILSGQSLIRAAELRAVASEYNRYITAVHTFRDKYFAVPGDFNNATSFWGRIGGGTGQCATPTTDSDTGTPTCNGDGNGQVDYINATLYYAEFYRFWEHLAAAGLIEGNYTGVSGNGAAGYQAVVGQNIPYSRISGKGFSLWQWSPAYVTAQGNIWAGDYQHIMFYGASSGVTVTVGNALKAEEAWNIDSKIDDGIASTGRVRHPYTNTAGCVTGSTYDLQATSVSCFLVFMNIY